MDKHNQEHVYRLAKAVIELNADIIKLTPHKWYSEWKDPDTGQYYVIEKDGLDVHITAPDYYSKFGVKSDVQLEL